MTLNAVVVNAAIVSAAIVSAVIVSAVIVSAVIVSAVNSLEGRQSLISRAHDERPLLLSQRHHLHLGRAQ